MLDYDHIYNVYVIRPHSSGVHRQHSGKFAILDDGLHVLSDYFEHLSDLPEGVCHQGTLDFLQRMKKHPYFQIVSKGDVRKGLYPELLKPFEAEDGGDDNGSLDVKPDEPAQAIADRPNSFLYQRVGMERPRLLEYIEGTAHLDGAPLALQEIERIVQNVEQGLATLRYTKTLEKSVKKTKNAFYELIKAESPVTGSMDKLRSLVDAGHLDPEDYDTIRKELFEDEMVPGIGNKRAYRDFLETQPARQGVHVMMDANDFKSINDELGHEQGDNAIRTMGDAMQRAMTRTYEGQDPQGKLHRFGGDEFSAHFPQYEHASRFLCHLCTELEGVPAVGGTHKLSISAGLGETPQQADFALNSGAKVQKKSAVAALGGDPEARVGSIRAPHALYAHSAVPGREGVIPFEPLDKPPIRPPESPKPVQTGQNPFSTVNA